MAFDFSNQRVLVAGGGRGIGRAVALQFAAAGADVGICARGAHALEETRVALAAHGHGVHAMCRRSRPSARAPVQRPVPRCRPP